MPAQVYKFGKVSNNVPQITLCICSVGIDFGSILMYYDPHVHNNPPATPHTLPLLCKVCKSVEYLNQLHYYTHVVNSPQQK